MSTSLSSQLQAIKSSVKGGADVARRPATRPSVIFDPKEAADIDLRTILPIALSGLEVLIELDARFGRYKNTLFSQTSLELDREKMVPKEEEKVNMSICSYLRLLSGHLQLPAALKTLEYLIRRYLVHVFNIDELILCALPYHDTHAFVRIVQLLDLGNKKWAFLEGVKTSGAPPPRKVIVQQCIRDKGVLEALSHYASPAKDFQHPGPVICFCTAIIVESLGSVPKLDTDTVKRVLGFVFDGLNPATSGGRDHKAGALMVVGLLATRAILASKLVQNLVFFIARVAQHDATEFLDLSWLRVTIMAIISLVQSQSVQTLPKKTVMILNETRDFMGVLSGLSREFNIQKFLSLYLETLLEYSTSDDSCRRALIGTIETLPLKALVEKIVSKVLAYCMKLSRNMEHSNLHEAGKWVKQVLLVIDRHYPRDLQGAVHKFLESSKMDMKGDESIFHTFCTMLDGSSGMPLEISDSKLWLSLEHPKASVRQATLANLATSGIPKDMAANSKNLTNIHDAMVRRLHDDDLSVVQAALSIDGLVGIIDPPCLLKLYRDILFRCIEKINEGTLKTSKASDAAISCLEHMVLELSHHLINSEEVATIIFPLLLVRPKTWAVNLKALELAKHVQWSLFSDSPLAYDPKWFEQIKSSESGDVTSINLKTIGALSRTIMKDPLAHIQWLIKCSKHCELSKTLVLFIILQALTVQNEDPGNLLKLYRASSDVLTLEWEQMESGGSVILAEEVNVETFSTSCTGLVDQVLNADLALLNVKILICIYWCLLKIFMETVHLKSSADNIVHLSILDELFIFFAKSPSKNAFKKHLCFLVRNCSRAPFQFLSKYFTEEGLSVQVQIESLNSFSTVCSTFALSERSSIEESFLLQLLLGFPPLLVPLCNENKDIRVAAVNCIERLHSLLIRFISSRSKNGIDTILSCSVSTPTLCAVLESIFSQRNLISSDMNFLPAFLASLLSPSSSGLLVPENTERRFDQPTKDTILRFILSSSLTFSSYGKLMVLSLLKGTGKNILLVEGVKSLFFELLERRNQHRLGLNNLDEALSSTDIKVLCLLLEVCTSGLSSCHVDADILDCLIKAIKVDGPSSNNLAVVLPCLTVLQNLTCAFYDCLKTEIQDEFFGNLVSLFRNDNGDIRNAARDVFLRTNITCSSVVRFLELILAQDTQFGSVRRMKKNKSLTHQRFGLSQDSFNTLETRLSFLCSLLDILLLKKNMEKRISLVQPLLQVLEKLFSNDWFHRLACQSEEERNDSSDIPESVTGVIYYARQTTLLILKVICDSCKSEQSLEDGFSKIFNMTFLIDCARSAMDVPTRNHVFLLLSSIAKISSGWLSEHIIDIFTVIGESVVTQTDSHSQHVLEDLISTIVPCWLSKSDSKDKLLQIFIKALPAVAEYRRLTLIVFLLRTLGEKCSLGVLVVHLFRSLILRISQCSSNRGHQLLSSSTIMKEWEYVFAAQLFSQYSCKIWCPCLVNILEGIDITREHDNGLSELHLAMQFILQKLQDTELVFELESGEEADYLQGILGALMEQVILHLQVVSVRRKQLDIDRDLVKDINECADGVLKTVTRCMVPSAYFKVVARLLGHTDEKVKKKTLGLICETIKARGSVQKKHKERRNLKLKSGAFLCHIDKSATPAFNELCLKIVELIDSPLDDSDTTVKLPAISSLELLTKELPSENMIFATCLACVVRHIGSTNLAISASCLRATGGLVTILGSKALSQLPQIMKHTLEKAHDLSSCPLGKNKERNNEVPDGLSSNKVSLLISVLITLEAIVENFGGFLNPYLEDILDLIILHPEYAFEIDVKLKLKAATLRRLLPQKIPARLLLMPLIKIYSSALKSDESSLSLAFEMLANMVGAMDRSSIISYHVKIFEQCLMALDLRRQHPDSVKDINMVEQSVINAMISLTMKLTENMFRPLFLHSLEWAESELEGSESIKSRILDRAISFYKLVNKLIEQHRSLFVPYFKYLIEGCTRYLTEDQDSDSSPSIKKRKKSKVGDAQSINKVMSPKQWHLRALILKVLYQCFLYDTTDLKFLDASNFPVLLKPIVSQLAVEPPVDSELLLDIPTVDEVDESLVLCLGQMAVAARSDVLWKPLNKEVLMHTRSEKIRPRILGLKVVRYLVEHLKEEYLVFLPETIPFLGELLEDVELPVKTLAQQVLKEMETLSGEDLKQYL